jgi:hypothetical protein
MSRIMVRSVAQRAIGCPVIICANEGKLVVSFSLHSELNVLAETRQVVKEIP